MHGHKQLVILPDDSHICPQERLDALLEERKRIVEGVAPTKPKIRSAGVEVNCQQLFVTCGSAYHTLYCANIHRKSSVSMVLCF